MSQKGRVLYVLKMPNTKVIEQLSENCFVDWLIQNSVWSLLKYKEKITKMKVNKDNLEMKGRKENNN